MLHDSALVYMVMLRLVASNRCHGTNISGFVKQLHASGYAYVERRAHRERMLVTTGEQSRGVACSADNRCLRGIDTAHRGCNQTTAKWPNERMNSLVLRQLSARGGIPKWKRRYPKNIYVTLQQVAGRTSQYNHS